MITAKCSMKTERVFVTVDWTEGTVFHIVCQPRTRASVEARPLTAREIRGRTWLDRSHRCPPQIRSSLGFRR